MKLLHDNGITWERMNEEVAVSTSVPAPQQQLPDEEYHSRAEADVANTDRIWREMVESKPKLQTVTFNIEGLGRGTVAMLRSPSGPKHPNMLAWFSHGYESEHPITLATPRHYGFAVEAGKSMNRRTASVEVFQSLPDALAGSGAEPTGAAPGVYVQPHYHAKEIGKEVDRVVGLVNHCDVAVLMDFQWSENNVAEEYQEAWKARTAPLPVIIEKASALNRYSSLLIFTCRTPWSVNAAGTGSSQLKEKLRNELMDGGMEPDDAMQAAEERYEAAPRMGTVHR
ncbi:hypothetical protein ACF1BK_10615 [Streptomyces globisporus]|uniref:hypothetical protein n=1 Tax=Streptomyces globisporus TaxID=1908 RepID=UPI0036F9DBD6